MPILLALALQVTIQMGPPPRPGQTTVVRDSSGDSTSRSAARRLPVTPALLASAFKDARAKDLFSLAQAARITLDSSIHSYEAKSVQRMSVGVGLGKIGRDRLLYRRESAARVRWQEGVGAHVDLTGARVAIPMVTVKEEDDALRGDLGDAEMSPIPYFPGYESMWIGSNTAKVDVNDRDIVNPLARGAEAYYTFETGDSVSWTFPDGFTVRLLELRVRPRSAEWNLAVGSLWIDRRTGQLVRAAYRLAVPFNMWTAINEEVASDGEKPVPALVAGFVSPLELKISAVGVEYVLVEGRFWLPRNRSMEGTAQLLFAHVPVKIETAFSYESVNRLSLPPIPRPSPQRIVVTPPRPPPGADSATVRRFRDSGLVVSAAARALLDSVRRGLRPPDQFAGGCVPNPDRPGCTYRTARQIQCDTAAKYTVTRYRYDSRLPVSFSTLCSLDSLKNSPDLPASIYDPGEELFGSASRDAMIKTALDFGAQAPFQVRKLLSPDLKWGLSMTRYNRVEGFSSGVSLENQLGAGYVVTTTGRMGVADREPNFELSIARTNLSKTLRVTGYNRLVSAGDWGNPLSFGSSVAALLFGRDEGFYYRASGAELQWTSERGTHLEWRAFGEHQRTAEQNTTYSWGPAFRPNIESASGMYAGAAVRYLRTQGQNPRGLRLFTDVRLEGASGDSTYGRGAAEATIAQGLGAHFAAAMTVAGGASVGGLPLQRHWYLGGSSTIRGQRADTAQHGNAFWFGRAELARTHTVYRTVLFGDLGWTGERSRYTDVGRPMSGVGLGWSMFDSMIRVDVSRGLYPLRAWRVDGYLEARF